MTLTSYTSLYYNKYKEVDFMPNHNNNTYTILREVYAQRTGISDIASIDLQGIIDAGKAWSDIEKEQFLNALSAAYMNTIYLNAEYNDRYNDIFYEDSHRFGAITRAISIEIPEVIANPAWDAIVSGTTTIGSNVVYLPIVNETLFATTTSWALPVAYTGTQLDQAFSSVDGLIEFEAYVNLVAQNGVKAHRAYMNGINRNNYIGEKIALQNTQATKKHVVNLVQEYCDYTGATSMTAKAFLQNQNAIRYAIKTLKKYKSLMMDNTVLFTSNAESRGQFVNPDRFVFQILSDFEGLIESEVYSSTFHEEFVKLPFYRNVPSWQALNSGDSIADFDTLSSIEVTTSSGTEVSQSGIVAFMCDKWAIMHTNVKNRVGVQRDDIKDITLNQFQFTDKYMNNLTLNGCVFVVQDVSAPAATNLKK